MEEYNEIPLIFLNKDGTCSSSKGKVPQRRAYKITPQDHTSTSGPAYNLESNTINTISKSQQRKFLWNFSKKIISSHAAYFPEITSGAA